MQLRQIFLTLAATVAAFMLSSCIEDGVSTSAGDQPTFSTDTLDIGDVLTDEGTPTRRFIVYNRHDKIINIDQIGLRDDAGKVFRLNVDGLSGETFTNVEIRPNDSIFVFVEATLPVNGVDKPVEVRSHLDFLTRGVTNTVVITARGQDAVRLRGETIEADTRFTADKPYQIFDSLVVAPGVTLTLAPGTRLLFHDKKSYLRVYGTLKSLGRPGANVEMTGDRTGYVAAKIPYEVMSGQWTGVSFMKGSRDNELRYTSIRNTIEGVTADGCASSPGVTIVASQLRNSQGYVLSAVDTDLFIASTELADASAGVVRLEGGTHTINHCTIANYYLFSALGGPAIQFAHVDGETDNGSGRPYLKAEIANAIVYGNGSEFSHGDLTGCDVMVRRTLIRSNGSDDDNFIECLWGMDPAYYTVREDYHFDYRLRPESEAIGQGDPGLMHSESAVDRYGVRRDASAPDLGAYVFVMPDL